MLWELCWPSCMKWWKCFNAQDRKRSQKLILRLYNLCWRHAILCWKVMTPTTASTSRKLFRIYFHVCVPYSAFLLCLASHCSTNAELFERLFEELANITSKTWKNQVENLVSNGVLHMQAEISGGNKAATCITRQDKEISNNPKMSSTHMWALEGSH